MTAEASHIDCKDLVNKFELHDRRLNDLDKFKIETTSKLQSIEAWQQATCKTMTETRTEVVTKQDSLASAIKQIELILAKESGAKEQSNKNLYLFITLMGMIPTIAIIIWAVISAFKPMAH